MPSRHRVHNLFPWGVLVLLLAATAVTTWVLSRSEQRLARARFERSVEERVGRIAARADSYVALLFGSSGLFAAESGEGGDDGEVTRAEFNRFVAELDLHARYPGLTGIGWSPVVTDETIPVVEARARGEGLDGFRVWPVTDHELRTTILYIQPSNRRNGAAYGFDMASEPVRAEAMGRARDTGGPVMSGKVTLVQEIDEEKQAGFLIYMPVYSTERPPASLEERRRHLRGFVYAAVRAGDMLEVTVTPHEEIGDFQVYDGLAPAPDALLHDAPSTVEEPALSVLRHVPLVNHAWTARFVAEPGLAAPSLAARWFAAVGVLVSFVVFAFALAQARARRALLEEKHRAEEAAELRERLLAIVGHDLRNPLGAISLSAQSMLRRAELDERARVAAKRIVDSSTRMARMIAQLMDYARLRQGQELTLSFGPCDLPAAVEHAIDEIRVMRPDVSIQLDVLGREACICDADRVAEVVSNLVANATQHGDGSVHVRLDQGQAGVILEVHNGGPAIPAELLPRIFDPFHRAEDRSRTPSSAKNLGLGLYIARQIVAGHGGRIDVRSSEADGTMFSVWLPREPR